MSLQGFRRYAHIIWVSSPWSFASHSFLCQVFVLSLHSLFFVASVWCILPPFGGLWIASLITKEWLLTRCASHYSLINVLFGRAGVLCPPLKDYQHTNPIHEFDPSSLYAVNTTLNNYTTTARVTCITGYAIDPFNWSNNTVDTYCNEFGNWSTYPITCHSKNIA